MFNSFDSICCFITSAMPVSEIVHGNSGTIPSSNHPDPSNKVMYGQYGSFVFKDWFGDKPNEKPEHQITHRETFFSS